MEKNNKIVKKRDEMRCGEASMRGRCEKRSEINKRIKMGHCPPSGQKTKGEGRIKGIFKN